LVGGFIELGDYLTIKALADSFLIKIEKEKFYDYMSSHMELVLHVLENVNKDLKTKQENEEALT
jgi:hypothetical protein